MKNCVFILMLLIIFCCSFTWVSPPDVVLKSRVLVSGLSDPWSVVYGPDNQLWVTESKGYRVLRVNPLTGEKQTVLDLASSREFPAFDKLKKLNQATPQGGLMGIAIHPDFLTGQPFVYVSYVYRHLAGNQFLLKLQRFTFDSTSGQLKLPITICDTIPASNDHNGGRMLIAPADDGHFLFYAVGDQGSGQFSNGARQNKAQNILSYEGKILRFNLMADSGGSWVPKDNPYGSQSAVWSFGHRNPQGLAFTTIAGRVRLYASEHGPYSDDEINLIEKGKNYGHPLVIGYVDGNYDGLAASVSNENSYPGKWHSSYPYIGTEKRNADSIGANFKAPVFSFYPTGHGALLQLFNSIKRGGNPRWKSYAPSGIALYQSDAIPQWKNSLLITSLKTGRLLRLKLTKDGSIVSEPYEYAASAARYRDVAVSPDGTKIFLVTDSSSITSGPTTKNPKAISERGCILELSLQQD